MTPNDDREWQELARDWQTGGEPPRIPSDVRRRVQRFSLGLYALTAAEILFLGALLVFFTRLAWIRPEPVELVTAAMVWTLGLAAMGFTLQNRRGTWRPAGGSTRDFVELSHKRCVHRLRGVRFAWRLLAAEVLFFLPWIAWVIASNPEKLARAPGIYFTSYGFLAAMVGVMAIGLEWYRRRTEREMREMEEILGTLDESADEL